MESGLGHNITIREMLEKELSECEKLALFEKSEKLFASKERKGNGPKTPPESGGGGAHNVNTSFQTNQRFLKIERI